MPSDKFQIKLERSSKIRDECGDVYILNEFSDGSMACYLHKKGWLSNAVEGYAALGAPEDLSRILNSYQKRATSIRISPSTASNWEWSDITEKSKDLAEKSKSFKDLVINAREYFQIADASLIPRISKASLILFLATVSYVSNAKAGLKGDIEYIRSKKETASVVRTNAFYSTPGNLSGFSFVDLKKGKKGYSGKTSLEKEVVRGFNLRGELVHSNDFFSEAGIGINVNAPTPKNSSLKIKLMPLWTSPKEKIKEKIIAGYSFAVRLIKDLKLSGFGGWDISDKPEWNYGEIKLGRKIGKVNVNYHGALRGDGDATPDIEHGASVGVDF